MIITGDLDYDVRIWATKNIFVNGTCPDMYKPLITGNMSTFYLYVFPVQFFLGVIGNALNLCVLLSRNMRSEANYLLSALAIADILLFLTMLPSALGVWQSFYTNDIFRYMGISSPMQKRCIWRESRVRCMMVFLIVGSLLLTVFHHFEYKYGYATMCNGTLTYAKLIPIEKLVPYISTMQVRIVTVLKTSQIILVVILPLIGVIVLNLRIIVVLRRSSVLVTRSTKQYANNQSYDFLCDNDSRQKRDRKATITVLAIIACFFLTHTPSTLPFILELILPLLTSSQREIIRRLMPQLGPIVLGWLLTGKSTSEEGYELYYEEGIEYETAVFLITNFCVDDLSL
ncbi:7 transmembrane receptor [Dictyocaulus viviparus]|uniref:7 transmembrane receptor n=1 Tax=Dictyocaulus viviparus TaxID=29172 RepID=A0A0D8XK06_DICVI|nr:7 transmembrane receptor [Dictyocaulus viviparus]